jgi:hypothetical protein
MHYNSTADTPEVHYQDDAGTLAIRGRSLPEDAWAFYGPLIEWAKALSLKNSERLTIEFFLEYFNSSSGRYLLELLSTLEKKGKDRVSVVWMVEPDDELMVEKGEEFSSLLEIPFRFVTAN